MTYQHTDWLNRHDYTEEERERICIELLGEAQYWDAYQYVRHMSDNAKRPKVRLSDTQIENVYYEMTKLHRGAPMPWGQIQFGKALQEKFIEVNT